MIRTELFKIRHHRTPRMLVALYSAFVLIPSVYYLFRPSIISANYLDVMLGVYLVAGSILAAIFGSWIVGNEYKQGTLRRVLATDARRSHLLGAKLVVGSMAAIVGLVMVAAVGVGGAVASAAMNGPGLDYTGLLRSILATGFPSFVTFLIGFGLSIVTRSNTYAVITTIGVMSIFGQLLALVPRFGKYTPAAVTNHAAGWIEGASGGGELSNPAALATLALMLAGLGVASVGLFNRRDI